MRLWKVTFCALSLGIVLMGQTQAQAGIDDDTRKLAAEKIQGRQIYQSHCVSCHGSTGAGQANAVPGKKVPDFTTPQAVVTYDFDRMLKGIESRHDAPTRSKWKETLADQEYRAVTAYMREAFMLPAITEDASRGRVIYAKTCSVCHGDRGNGASWAKNSLDPSPFDFTSQKAKELSRRHMINTVTYGSPKTAMMGFSTQLTRSDIAAVVDYVRSTFVSGEDLPETGKDSPASLNFGNRLARQKGGASGVIDMQAAFPDGLKGDAAWGKKFYNENCYVCHGKEGRGDGPRAYFIQPKPANLTTPESRQSLNRPQLLKSISLGINGTEMPAWSKVLTPQEVANVAEYVFAAFIEQEPAKEPPAKPQAGQKKN